MRGYRGGLFGLLVLCMVACSGSAVEEGRTTGSEGRAGLWNNLTRENDYRALISDAVPALEEAEKAGDDATVLAAGVYLGQAYLMLAQPDSMYYWFNRVAHTVPNLDEEYSAFYLMVMNNSRGIHNLMYAMNYNEALHYFYEAIESSPPELEKQRQIIKSNIVNVFYLREDAGGIDMALDIYEWGRENEDDFVTYRGALVSAYMYFLAADYEKALEYVAITTGLEPYSQGFANSDALHGSILSRLGRYAEAETYFRRGLKESVDKSTIIESYLAYGNFLYDRGRVDEAIGIYLKGLEIVEEYGMYFYGHRLYNSLAEAYSSVGRDDIAVRYMMTYQNLVSDVFNVGQERSFSDLRLRYEKARKESELREKDMILMKQKQRTMSVSVIAVLLIGVVAAVLIMYRRKLLMYRELVQRYDSQMKREKSLSGAIAEGNDADDKLMGIFRQMETLMKDGLYKRNDLTLDMMADMLQTNRSYISKAVNTYALQSFNAYVNTYRIRRAVELLSDPECRIPIKAVAEEIGYNNLTSFYTNFQKETGVPPSKYHQEIIRMNNARADVQYS